MIIVEANKPIAVVDDDEVDRFIVTRVIDKSNLANEVISFDSGSAILDHIETVADGTSKMPALVLLDINMPGMTGFEVLRALKMRSDLGAIPIVTMLSSSEAEQDIRTAEELGADDYLPKQSGIDDYVDMINSKFANPDQ